jgi:hypothetical protein
VKRRLRDPSFRAELVKLAADSVDVTMSALVGATGGAVRALSAILDDLEAPASTRVAAARTILDGAYRFASLRSVDAPPEPLGREALRLSIMQRVRELKGLTGLPQPQREAAANGRPPEA